MFNVGIGGRENIVESEFLIFFFFFLIDELTCYINFSSISYYVNTQLLMCSNNCLSGKIL